MALRAGAALLDMEFVQFHPTALAVAGAPRFLISEAVRGEGALLLNGRGDRFVDELAPRDQVARAIAREDREGRGPVTLDLRHLDAERVRTRFPRIHRTCLRYGVDITQHAVPVTPAAHYVMGGVDTDEWGRTSLAGLYAAGEVACTGVHGANRLASNSLLEGLVFGARAAEAMVEDGNAMPGATADAGASQTRHGTPAATLRRTIQERCWDALGLERDGPRLLELARWLQEQRDAQSASPSDRPAAEARNLADVAWAMASSAAFREESRGAHFRTDFPHTDDARFRGHSLLEGGSVRLVDVEIPLAAGARC
jgi:L-aspartate oxidase